MKNLKSWVSLTTFLLVIPIIGIIVSTYIAYGYEAKYENAVIQSVWRDRGVDVSKDQSFLDRIQLNNICKRKDLDEPYVSVCSEYRHIIYLGYVSSLALGFSILALLLGPVFGIFSMKNRKVLFYLFRPGLFVSQLIAAVLIIADAAILIFSIYLAEAYFFNGVTIFLIAGLGCVAAYTALIVCIKALTPIRCTPVHVIGKILPKSQYPQIWKFVESIANRIGTTPPQTIIIGSALNFFVVEANVICIKEKIKGKSLYLSLPFCKVLTQSELTAIIGHEMGHFVGEDTLWSTKFYPIYRGSIDTLHALYYSYATHANALVQFALKPALYFMSFFIYCFTKAETAIGRERELNADKVGVKITSSIDMARALLKAHIYPNVWQILQEKIKTTIAKGKEVTNISESLSTTCELVAQNYLQGQFDQASIPHPTDTHPPLSTRLNSIGVQLSTIHIDSLKPPITNVAIELIDHVGKLEQELLVIEN